MCECVCASECVGMCVCGDVCVCVCLCVCVSVCKILPKTISMPLCIQYQGHSMSLAFQEHKYTSRQMGCIQLKHHTDIVLNKPIQIK